jgi:hypothetical protein
MQETAASTGREREERGWRIRVAMPKGEAGVGELPPLHLPFDHDRDPRAS